MENRKEKIRWFKNKRKKVQELALFWRKVILFSVLFVLAVPLCFLIVKRFTKITTNFDGSMIMKEFEMDKGIGESFLEIQEATQELQEQLSAAATTSTSTDDISSNTTTTEDY